MAGSAPATVPSTVAIVIAAPVVGRRSARSNAKDAPSGKARSPVTCITLPAAISAPSRIHVRIDVEPAMSPRPRYVVNAYAPSPTITFAPAVTAISSSRGAADS